MKEYIKQIYEEGLGYTFLQKPLDYLNKKIKDKKIFNIIKYLYYIIFTTLIIILTIIIFKWQFPL